MEKEPLFNKKEIVISKESAQNAVSNIMDIMEKWIKIPESNLTPEKFKHLSKNNPTEAQRLKENKFRKNYFNNIGIDLFFIYKYLEGNQALQILRSDLDHLIEEIQIAPLVTEAQIDKFDKLVKEIINLVEV